MRKFSIVLLATLVAVSSVAFGHSRHYRSSTSHSHSISVSTDVLDNGSRNFDFRGKKVIIK